MAAKDDVPEIRPESQRHCGGSGRVSSLERSCRTGRADRVVTQTRPSPAGYFPRDTILAGRG